MSSSVGKRQRERQKVERAQAKAERKAARLATDPEETEDLAPRTETELMDDLAELHRSFEAGGVSPEDFEARREQIQAQFDRLLR